MQSFRKTNGQSPKIIKAIVRVILSSFKRFLWEGTEAFHSVKILPCSEVLAFENLWIWLRKTYQGSKFFKILLKFAPDHPYISWQSGLFETKFQVLQVKNTLFLGVKRNINCKIPGGFYVGSPEGQPLVYAL